MKTYIVERVYPSSKNKFDMNEVVVVKWGHNEYTVCRVCGIQPVEERDGFFKYLVPMESPMWVAEFNILSTDEFKVVLEKNIVDTNHTLAEFKKACIEW